MTDRGDLIADLRAERQRQELSMHALGEKFGASSSSIHDWEHGVHVPTLTSLRAWAGALGYVVTLKAVAVTGDDDRPPLVEAKIVTRHPFDYLLTNLRDGSRWILTSSGKWIRALPGDLHRS